jgi:hypothetical protein
MFELAVEEVQCYPRDCRPFVGDWQSEKSVSPPFYVPAFREKLPFVPQINFLWTHNCPGRKGKGKKVGAVVHSSCPSKE